MDRFKADYIEILQRQVTEEIAYLIDHGHDLKVITIPCIFCIKHSGRQYFCKRLDDLLRFQQTLDRHKRGKQEWEEDDEELSLMFPSMRNGY